MRESGVRLRTVGTGEERQHEMEASGSLVEIEVTAQEPGVITEARLAEYMEGAYPGRLYVMWWQRTSGRRRLVAVLQPEVLE